MPPCLSYSAHTASLPRPHPDLFSGDPGEPLPPQALGIHLGVTEAAVSLCGRTLEVMRARGWDTDQRGIAAIIIITTSNNWSDHIFLHLPLGSAGEASPGLEMAQEVNQNGSTPLQLPQCVGAL